MNSHIILFVTLLALAMPRCYGSDTSRKPQRIGDLSVTFMGIKQQEPRTNSDHHVVVVRFNAQNIGKQALCAGFNATLKASFGLEYRGSLLVTNPFRIRELLPGENSEGAYEFYVKNGAEPLQVILKPSSETQTCTPGKDSFSSIWHSADELKFDLSQPAERTSQPSARSPEQPNSSEPAALDETSTLKVFLTGAKGDAPKETALKAFQDRCPQARVTTVREKANYIVMLSPAGFKQSKNRVTVINSSGDLIHTGETFNLHNAANDACVAILKDFRAASRNNAQH